MKYLAPFPQPPLQPKLMLHGAFARCYLDILPRRPPNPPHLFPTFTDLPQSREIRGTQWLRALFSKLDLDADDRVTTEELHSLSEERWQEVENMEEEIADWIEGLITNADFEQDEL